MMISGLEANGRLRSNEAKAVHVPTISQQIYIYKTTLLLLQETAGTTPSLLHFYKIHSAKGTHLSLFLSSHL